MILHKPVLLNETLSFLRPTDQIIVDCTLGHAGHAIAIIKKLEEERAVARNMSREAGTGGTPLQVSGGAVCLIGIDADQKMLSKAKQQITNYQLPISNFHFIHDSYINIDKILKNRKADFVLLDLGVNLEHFLDSSRGFSIVGNADLDMRYDQNSESSAYNIINQYPAAKLIEIFMNYGDFTAPKAKQIADQIVINRNKKPFKTTFDLKKLLNELGLGNSACAIIFQSIRIETNQEIKNLETLLNKLPNVLNSGGRCIVISYHSIEDRLVKNTFKNLEATSQFKILTKKAVQPHYKEVQANKAARSAKLRTIERL